MVISVSPGRQASPAGPGSLRHRARVVRGCCTMQNARYTCHRAIAHHGQAGPVVPCISAGSRPRGMLSDGTTRVLSDGTKKMYWLHIRAHIYQIITQRQPTPWLLARTALARSYSTSGPVPAGASPSGRVASYIAGLVTGGLVTPQSPRRAARPLLVPPPRAPPPRRRETPAGRSPSAAAGRFGCRPRGPARLSCT